MARWTMRQEEILREPGHRGVGAVRAIIAEECGVVHSHVGSEFRQLLRERRLDKV